MPNFGPTFASFIDLVPIVARSSKGYFQFEGCQKTWQFLITRTWHPNDPYNSIIGSIMSKHIVLKRDHSKNVDNAE
jgi:hypothetical protein